MAIETYMANIYESRPFRLAVFARTIPAATCPCTRFGFPGVRPTYEESRCIGSDCMLIRSSRGWISTFCNHGMACVSCKRLPLRQVNTDNN